MTESIRFYFDPGCPWTWQTSKWVRQLESSGHIELTWGLFSLALQNDRPGLKDPDPEAAAEASTKSRSGHALRTGVVVRSHGGSAALGRYYEALGTRVHHRHEDLGEPETVKGALTDAGLEISIYGEAMSDPASWQEVLSEHTDLCERTGCFGVPSIVLDSGNGPAIFGPVLSEPPATEAEAVELLGHVVALVRNPAFAELKRNRPELPELG